MRRLTHNEATALDILAERDYLVPGDALPGWSAAGLTLALDGLVKTRRAQVEATDDGPRYSITAIGREQAA